MTHSGEGALGSEAELLAALGEAAKARGWRVMHQRPARTAHGWRTALQGDPGWPDLVLLRRANGETQARLLCWELKAAKGRVSDAQDTWLLLLEQVPGVECAVIRPADYDEALRRLE